jgi:hypothetical protein
MQMDQIIVKSKKDSTEWMNRLTIFDW